MHTGLPMDNKQLVGVVSDAAGGWSSEAAGGGRGNNRIYQNNALQPQNCLLPPSACATHSMRQLEALANWKVSNKQHTQVLPKYVSPAVISIHKYQ